MRLVLTLERLLGKGSNGTNDLLIISTLDLIHGTLLLHPPSRTLFAREIYMNILLDLLDPINCPAIQSTTLLALVTALLDTPTNTRTFEDLDGLLTVTSLFKSRSTSREVRLKLVEFLYFYLMPEIPPTTLALQNIASAPNTALGGPQRPSSSKLNVAFSRSLAVVGSNANGSGSQNGNADIRTPEEKQDMLSRYLSNVEDLVEDLRETAPFGTAIMC